MATESVAIPTDAIRDIRRCLLVGLHAYGECERVQTESRAAEKMGLKIDRALIPTMLTGNHETASFAEALNWLELCTPAEDDKVEA